VSEEQRDLNRSRAVLVHTLQRIAQTGVMPSDRQNVRDLILDLDPPLDDQQGRNEARCEQRRRGEQWHVPRAPVPLPSAARAGGLTTDDTKRPPGRFARLAPDPSANEGMTYAQAS
jgi:hypothetical protein